MSSLSAVDALAELAAAEEECRRCPLWKPATQAVPGSGSTHARLMLVGEQPGDKEDIEGKPFVGPAGRLLDQAMSDAGLPRSQVYLTNAVKHFKHEQRGKKRLHKRPNAYEIDRCRWWLSQEIELIKPCLAVALGATAFRSIASKPGKISELRGRLHQDMGDVPIFVTIHPSYMLRVRGHGDRDREYHHFVDDLKECRRLINET